MFERLKTKWNIKSNTQLALVLTVFALTGSSSAWLTRWVFHHHINSWVSNEWMLMLLRIIFITGVYPFILILVGSIFGQYIFFKSLLRRWAKAIFKI